MSRRTTLAYQIILSLLLVCSTYAGYITPSSTSPIAASVANKNELSDYTFTFSPETAMPIGTEVHITFPGQYRSGLGVPIAPSCSVSCSISDRTVTFVTNTAYASGSTVTIIAKDIENPESKGGTGNFKVSTQKGVNVLDENAVFGTVGIAKEVATLGFTNVVLDTSGTSSTGEATRYAFSFKVTQTIQATSVIRLTVSDTGFGLGGVSGCSVFPINGKTIQGTWNCTAVGRDIFIEGLSAEIPALQDVGISVPLTNPSVAGQTLSFAISVYRGLTNIILDRRSDIPGVTITPSNLTGVSLTPVDSAALQAKNKVMDYTLVFTLKNSLQVGSIITLAFSSDFHIDSTTSAAHFINYGLEDISESSPVVMAIDYDTSIITLSNYKAVTNGTQISLQVRLQNPSQAGATGTMTMYTYVDSGKSHTIDADLTSAFTTIQSIESPTSYSITTQSLVVNTLQTLVEFMFRPSITVAASGVLKIRVPSSFTFAAGTCNVKSAVGSYTAATCSNTGGVVTLTLPGSVTFASGTDNYFSFNSLLKTPATNNGTYLFDVTSYQSDGTTVIESWTSPLTVVAAPFTTTTATTLVVGAGLRTVLTFTYQPSVNIPAGVTQTTTNDTKGVLEFEFSGVANDLGTALSSTGSIPCKPISAAITPAAGQQLKCTLTPGASPVIRVDNFPTITAGSTITIAFPKLQNPSPAPSGGTISVKVKAYQLQKRIRTELNTGSVTISVQAAGALVESGTITASSYTFTNNAVLGTTDLSFKPGTTTVLTGAGTILVELPYYGNGYVPYPNTLTCKLGSTTVTCVGYEGSDWVAITLPAASTFPTNTAITISGLKVPQYSTTLYAGPTFRYILTSSQQETVNRPQQIFPAATIPAFTTASFTTSNTNLNAVNVDYTFTLVSPNPIPQGASIVITFPSAYNVLASKPPVTFSSTTLVAATTSGISFTRSYSQVIITNFQAIAAGANINIKISGVKNPNSVTQSIGWTAEVKYLTGTMLSSPSFQQFDFSSSTSVGIVNINSINVFPLNALQEAEYNITITPQTAIPIAGEIQITFPSANYLVLPSPPKCRITGALTTYSKCDLRGSRIVMTLDTAYTTGTLKLTLSGIPNPPQGTTLPFLVETYYDSVQLDTTDTSVTTGRTVTFSSAPSAITMRSLTFAPKNEGEPATYTFSFLPTTTLTTDMYIKIIFPDVYDNNLGTRVTCSVTSGLTGNFLCGVDRRVVTLTGFSEYTPVSTNPITINIFNVINPNQNLNSDTKQFKIATIKKTGTSYVDINTMAGTLETLVAPGWAFLWGINSTNNNARTSADYTFNFSTFDNIPKVSSGGEVRVSLPVEFEMNDANLTCEPMIDNYATSLTCSIERNNIIVKGNTKDYGGNVVFVVKGITNPVSQGSTSNIQIKVYDNFNQKIVERTFPNLDVFTKSYVWPGPLISVNGDNPLTIERGTQTNDLFITTSYPSALNLSFTPTTPGFSIIPFYIDFPLGKASSKFRMSVDENFPLGTYYVQWTTLGELIPPYYTPLRRTQVTIVSNKNLQVQATNPLPIPMGGNSLYVTFTVPNGPYLDLGIAVSYSTDYPGITLSTSTVSFRAGQEKATLKLFASSSTPVSSGSLVLSLTGSNADIYYLQDNLLNFTVIAPITTMPTISAFNLDTILTNSVTFSVQATDSCIVYYMLALKNTDTPTLEEAVNLGPAAYTSTESKYGYFQINDPTILGSITINNLVAETPYVIFVYIVDRAGNNAGPTSKTFSTLGRYNAAEFQLQFTQSSLNSAEKQVVINAVAFLLSLNPSQVQEKIYNTRRLQEIEELSVDGGNGERRRFLEEEEDNSRMLAATTLVTLQIMAVPDSVLYPSPLTLALSLDSAANKAALNAKLKNFDPTYTVATTAKAFTRYYPAYSSQPSFVSVGTDYAIFKGQLNNFGHLYVVCVKNSEDKGTPTAYQVWRGLSSNNVKNPSATVEVSTASSDFSMTVTDLDESTDYNAYVIGGSAHPGFPDLMADNQVKKISFKTNAVPKTTTTKKKSGVINTVSGVLIGLLCLVFLL